MENSSLCLRSLDRMNGWPKRLVWMMALISLGPSSLLAYQAPDSEPASRTLVVATRHVPPFAIKDDQGQWHGIAIDLIRDIIDQWNETSETKTRLQFRESTLQGMLDLTAEGQVDLAAGALTVNFEREERMDFSHPFHSSGLGIAVSPDRRAGWMAVLSRVFSKTFLQLIGGLFALSLLAGVLIFLFERRANPEHFGHGTWRGIGSGIWWSIVTLTTVGYGDKAPKTIGGRLVAVIWMLAGLVIVSSFTAAVTSALTVGQLRSRVNGLADLSRVRVATVAHSTSQDFLDIRRIHYRMFDDIDDALVALEQNQVDAVVYDLPMLRYQIAKKYPSLAVLPAIFERQNYAFAMPSGSPLREKLNQSILRIIQDPQWQATLNKYLSEMSER